MKPKMRSDRSLTLSQRLMLWVALLLILLGFGEAWLISRLTDIRVPQKIETVVLAATTLPPTGSSDAVSTELAPVPSAEQPPASTDVLQETVLSEVRLISLVMAGMFAVIGVLGAYVISRTALRPLKSLSQTVKDIQADSLDQRLSLKGPEDEVKELADSFDRMLARLERAFDQQGEFVADAAHELRTPLATLRTQLEVIQQDSNATLSDYREMGATLIMMLDRLDRLTEDLLLLAKGEKQITREPVNLEVLLTEVIHELTPLAQASQVRLRLQMTEEIVLPADSRLLSRAVSNLVENGIRYNHPGGTVTVQADFQGNRLAIRVEDTGIGITESDLALIFERFYRVDRARDRNRGGSGLGLAISDHIVQLHGGEIRVSSTPGEGSSFTLWLPVKTP